MGKIITIGREFGSGGRELAKRLAEYLGFKYYDKEIVYEIAKNSDFNENYIENVENTIHTNFPYITGKTFSLFNANQKQATSIFVLQQKIIKSLAENGDCVFVGRCADVILKEYNPFNVFVYANLESKMRRCKEKSDGSENLSDKDLIKSIKNVDKSRKRLSLLLGADSWGKKENYDLCVNTSFITVKNIVPLLADYATNFFNENAEPTKEKS